MRRSIHVNQRYDDDMQRKSDHRQKVLHPPVTGKPTPNACMHCGYCYAPRSRKPKYHKRISETATAALADVPKCKTPCTQTKHDQHTHATRVLSQCCQASTTAAPSTQSSAAITDAITHNKQRPKSYGKIAHKQDRDSTSSHQL
jgi:hypothetical protein